MEASWLVVQPMPGTFLSIEIPFLFGNRLMQIFGNIYREAPVLRFLPIQFNSSLSFPGQEFCG